MGTSEMKQGNGNGAVAPSRRDGGRAGDSPAVSSRQGRAPRDETQKKEQTGEQGKEQTGKRVSERLLLIDVVKGLAISLVALGHTNQGVLNRGWWGGSQFGVQLDLFIYAFHMPAFFLVSGVFLAGSARKRGPWGFTEQKLRTILYPFVFWSLFLPFQPLAFGRFMHVQAPAMRPYLMNFVTGNMSWFLPTLFVAVTLAMLLRCVLRVPLAALFALTTAVAFFWPLTGVAALDAGIAHLPFVIAGMWLSPHLSVLERISVVGSGFGSAVLGGSVFLLTSHVREAHAWRFVVVPVGLLGTAMLLLLGRALGNSVTARALAWVGVGSIAVFLLSPLPQGGARQLLLWAHVTQPVVQLLLPTVIAIVLPAWIYQRRERLHLGWTFALPARHLRSRRHS